MTAARPKAVKKCTDCRTPVSKAGCCEACKAQKRRLAALHRDRGTRPAGRPRAAYNLDATKLRVPEPSAALYASALRVAKGEALKGDEARVRRELPGHELVFAARVVVLRGLWHECGRIWHA